MMANVVRKAIGSPRAVKKATGRLRKMKSETRTRIIPIIPWR